jgi:hypothetical protein
MRFVLVGLIRMYWTIVPEHCRRSCLFTESCSHYVYRTAREEGLVSGLLALRRRWLQCRDGYVLGARTPSGGPAVMTRDGSIHALETMRVGNAPNGSPESIMDRGTCAYGKN